MFTGGSGLTDETHGAGHHAVRSLAVKAVVLANFTRSASRSMFSNCSRWSVRKRTYAQFSDQFVRGAFQRWYVVALFDVAAQQVREPRMICLCDPLAARGALVPRSPRLRAHAGATGWLALGSPLLRRGRFLQQVHEQGKDQEHSNASEEPSHVFPHPMTHAERQGDDVLDVLRWYLALSNGTVRTSSSKALLSIGLSVHHETERWNGPEAGIEGGDRAAFAPAVDSVPSLGIVSTPRSVDHFEVTAQGVPDRRPFDGPDRWVVVDPHPQAALVRRSATSEVSKSTPTTVLADCANRSDGKMIVRSAPMPHRTPGV